MGRAVQVVRVMDGDDDTPTFELDEEALKRVLYQDCVKDLPVVVVSVAGRMRQGKSFLLNYMIHYLQNKGEGAWLEGMDVPVGGFQWRDGPDACTTGILLWSEVFVVDGPRGKRVAVLLMDTQGTFDTNTTMKECSTVFALSTMLSCVQVYNMMRDVKRDDLDSLQLFAEYAKMAQGRGHGDDKPFKSLQFLVRDWQWPDSHQLGARGGAEFIEERLRNANGIRSCFEQISCFLLPYPWNQTDGRCCGISDTFKSLINDLCSNILAWDQLETRIKSVEGETIKTKDMLTYFKSFVDIFRDEQLPSPKSAFDANVQITLTKAFEIGMKTFEETRKVITGDQIDEKTPSQEPESYEQSLLQCQALAVEEFRSRATLGANHEMSEHYLNRLKEDTETIVCALVGLNLVKRSNEEAFRKRNESDIEEKLAERRREEAERERTIAEERLQRAMQEKEEAERKWQQAERRGEKQDELFDILKTQTEMMMQKAMQDMKEAEDKRRQAERMREEADRMRYESEERARQTVNNAGMYDTFRRIVSDIISAATPFIPVLLSSFQGRGRSRSGRRNN